MLLKTQKIWMWIFGAMFVIPEILFFTTPSSVLSFMTNFSGSNIPSPIYFLVSPQFFVDHNFYVFFALAIEWIGVLGLLALSVKFKKKIFVILSGLIFVWVSLVFYVSYVLSTMNPIM